MEDGTAWKIASCHNLVLLQRFADIHIHFSCKQGSLHTYRCMCVRIRGMSLYLWLLSFWHMR